MLVSFPLPLFSPSSCRPTDRPSSMMRSISDPSNSDKETGTNGWGGEGFAVKEGGAHLCAMSCLVVLKK